MLNTYHVTFKAVETVEVEATDYQQAAKLARKQLSPNLDWEILDTENLDG
jgi:hypothetical protein